jgi:hypothetical protein
LPAPGNIEIEHAAAPGLAGARRRVAGDVVGPGHQWAPTGSAAPPPAPRCAATAAADAPSIVLRALAQVVEAGELERSILAEAIATYRLDDPAIPSS